MSQKKNTAKINVYDKDFPSLCDVKLDDNLVPCMDSFSYSARLKTVSRPEVLEKEEDNVVRNKKPQISSNKHLLKNERSKRTDATNSAKNKELFKNSPMKTFDRMSSSFIHSNPNCSLDEENDFSETKDTSSAWTVVKKKRANNENSRQNRTENITEKLLSKETLHDNKVNFNSKNNHESYRQNRNEQTTRKQTTSNKERFIVNKDIKFISKYSSNHENSRQNRNKYGAEKYLIKERLNNNNTDIFMTQNNSSESKFCMREQGVKVTKSKSRAEMSYNVNAMNFPPKVSAETNNQKNLKPGVFKAKNSDKYHWNTENRKNVSEFVHKQLKQKSSTYSETSEMFSRKPTLNENSNTEPNHIKSKNNNNSTAKGTQKNFSQPESVNHIETTNTSKSSKKRRKSKLKRQAGLQRDKVQLISPNVFDKILKLSNEGKIQTQKNMKLDINDVSEYPELGAAKSRQSFYSEIVQAEKKSKEEIGFNNTESPNKNPSLPADDVNNNAIGSPEESNPELEKLAVHHKNPITVSLFDIITNKTKKKKLERNCKFLFGVPSSTSKGKRSTFLSSNLQNVNPLDSSKPAIKRGKEREKPKLKKPSQLKKIILMDRKKRKEQIQSNKKETIDPESEETSNIPRITNLDNASSILISPNEGNQFKTYLVQEEINSNQSVLNATDVFPSVGDGSIRDSSNNVLYQNMDFTKDSMESHIQKDFCDPKFNLLSSQESRGSFESKQQMLFAENNVFHLQNDSDSKHYAISEGSSASHQQSDSCNSKYDAKECISYAQRNLCDSKNLVPFDESNNLLRQNESGISNCLINQSNSNVIENKVDSDFDTILYSIRYLFAFNILNEVMSAEQVLGDIRYLFEKENYPIMLHNNMSSTFFDDIKVDENNSIYAIKNMPHDLINDSFANDKIEVDKTLNTSFLSNENKLLDSTIEENKNGICHLKNEISCKSALDSELIKKDISSVDNLMSGEDFSKETVIRKYSKKEINQACLIVLHCKKFREYCDQFLCKSLDETVSLLLDDLARFQDRIHQKDPVKARMKRRLVYGIREIKRHVKLKKLKCVIIASDIEDSRSEGGLNDNLNELKSNAQDFQIPCVFSHSRRQLGKLCRKSAPVSAVGIFNYEGSEENFKKLLSLHRDCKMDYARTLKSLSSKLSDEQVELLCQTREENRANLYSLVTKLLKEFYPPATGHSLENDTSPCIHKNEAVEVYNILLKYRIINY